MARHLLHIECLDHRIVPSLMTTRTSTDIDFAPIRADAINPALSGDGRFVAFVTSSRIDASGADDSNGGQDVYLKDRLTGRITLVSQLTGTSGADGVTWNTHPSVSDDGRFVAYEKTVISRVFIPRLYGYYITTYHTYVLLRDTLTNTTTNVAEGDHPHLSGDGRFLTLTSAALPVPSGDVNGILPDIFRYDVSSGEFAVVSTDAAGVPGNIGYTTDSAVSRDGRYVAIVSSAATLVPGDANETADVFLKDTATGAVALVSAAADGTFGNGHSGRGRVSVSDDGRYVAFASEASNLVPGDTNGVADVFLRDVVLGSTVRLSASAGGSQGNGTSGDPVVSGNGRFVAFESESNDLVPGDTNGTADVFVKDRITGAIRRANVAFDGAEGNGTADSPVFERYAPAISRDGRFIAFHSSSTNLVLGDTNGRVDVFVHEQPLPAGYAAGPDAGGSSRVQVFDASGRPTTNFDAYPGFTGGLDVALGDLTGDGIADVVTGPGAGGGPNVRVFDGATHGLTASFLSFDAGFTGGVTVAVGDLNNDGFADIVCGPGAGGGPNVRVFSGKDHSLLVSVFAYDVAFTGGVRVAVGDANGDGYADVVCAPGTGGSANVRVLDGRQLALGNTSLGDLPSGGVLVASFLAYPRPFTGGVFVSAGDVDNDGRADVLTGAGTGGGPNVRAFDGETGTLSRSFFAFDSGLTDGVRVTSTDFDQDGYDDFVVTTGGTRPGTGGLVRGFSGKDDTTQLIPQLAPFDRFSGINVG